MVAAPRAAKRYGDALMRRSKTDQADAELLASYAERTPFEAYEPPEAVFVELRAITRRVQALTVEPTREKNHLQAEEASRTASPVVLRDIGVNIRHLTRRIDLLVDHALGLLEDSGELRQAFGHLVSIGGVAAKPELNFSLRKSLLMIFADESLNYLPFFLGSVRRLWCRSLYCRGNSFYLSTFLGSTLERRPRQVPSRIKRGESG